MRCARASPDTLPFSSGALPQTHSGGRSLALAAKPLAPVTQPWRTCLMSPPLWLLRRHLALGQVAQLDRAVREAANLYVSYMSSAASPQHRVVEPAFLVLELKQHISEFDAKLSGRRSLPRGTCHASDAVAGSQVDEDHLLGDGAHAHHFRPLTRRPPERG